MQIDGDRRGRGLLWGDRTERMIRENETETRQLRQQLREMEEKSAAESQCMR